jgi:hypothetical protein
MTNEKLSMAHFQQNLGTRISASTLYLAQGGTQTLSVWGMMPGLSIRSTDPDAVKVTALTPAGTFQISALGKPSFETPKIELLMGEVAWDYFEVGTYSGSLPKGYSKLHNYVEPGTKQVKLSVFWTKNAWPNTFVKTAEVCRLVLERHGLRLSLIPGVLRIDQHVLSFDEEIDAGGQIEELTEQVQKSGVSLSGRLVVINAPVRTELSGSVGNEQSPFGWTWPASSAPWGKNFVVLNSKKTSPTALSLLHEIGHAAGLEHMYDDAKSIEASFMSAPERGKYKEPGPAVLAPQVKKIANAFFVS